ncbi:recombinase family protein [Rosistilla oblonga]|uniref:Recombinase n=1 Tax=Rosistilla oblonga TaxID=2527990 RepID=A0A518J023_9BACT|nr:recombinase family protein [Rosistilla oblonga]QDV58694.1 Recombinase [Rosistilla oblonga]
MSKRKTKNACAAVGYIRMSSDKQEESPDQQRDEILKLAEKHGYKIIRWYEDHAVSGVKTFKGRQFLQMIDDVKRLGDFQAILCWDQDRFGRFDSIEAGEWISPLRRAGVELICVVQGRINWDDFAGRMIYQITQEGKNQFLVSLSNNVMRGMLKQARDGYGKRRTPYGYDRVYFDEAGNEMHRVVGNARFSKPKGWKAKLALSEADDEVETVKWIFDAYANSDANSRSIARDLNRRSLLTRNEIPWQSQSVRVLLRNPVYIGTMIYGANPQGRFNQVGDGRLGGDEPVVIENAHPAIIDKKTFKRVQAKLEDRRRPNGRTRAGDYLLSGLVVCGNSGDRMSGRRASVGTNVQYYSARVSSKPEESERCYAIRKDQLEPLVIAKIVSLLDTPNIERQLKAAVGRRLKATANKTSDTKTIRQRIAALEKNIAKGVERLLLLDGDDQDDASRMLADWRAERRTLEDQLQATTAGGNAKPEREAARVAAELARLRTTFAQADPAALRAALASVIEEITLYWTDGGPRKWRFQRGTIRLGGSLRLLASSTIKHWHALGRRSHAKCRCDARLVPWSGVMAHQLSGPSECGGFAWRRKTCLLRFKLAND